MTSSVLELEHKNTRIQATKPPQGMALLNIMKTFCYCLPVVGAPAAGCFTGTPPLLPRSDACTLPLMRITLVGSLDAFEVMVTDLLIGPMRFVSYFTVIAEVFPGAIGAFSH